MNKYAKSATVFDLHLVSIGIAIIDMDGAPVGSGHLHTVRQAALLATENIASGECNHTD